MNRQQRRREQRDGQPEGDDAALAAVGASTAVGASAGGVAIGDGAERLTRVVQPAGPARRATPRQFLHEVNVEMRKVAWPTRSETINYASVVLVTLSVLMALIFGLDLGFSKVSLFLFK